MKFFWAKSTPAYQPDGRYTWRLPSIRCPTCRMFDKTWGGIAKVDIAGKMNEEPYRFKTLRTPVSKAEFEEVVKPIEAFLPKNSHPRPGMGFGPFQGQVGRSEKRDFLWILDFNLLVKESAYQSLMNAGITLDTGPARMESSRPRQIHPAYQRIIEMQPVKCLAKESLEFIEWKNCSECGLRIGTRPKRIFLKKSLTPLDLPIFAIEETDQIIANEHFVEVVTALKLNNIIFTPVELVE